VKEALRFSPHYQASSSAQNRQVPDNLWHKCQRCGELIYTKQWEATAKVCPHCGHHGRITVTEWLVLLLDAGSWQEYDADLAPGDPLTFVSPRDSYAEKLTALQSTQGRLDAAVCGMGTIETAPLALCVLNFAFMGGSMGSVVGEKIARSAERAAALQVPLVTINASGGARMQEGILSLMQMAKVSVALVGLAGASQPHISVLTDPCYGGVTAAHASSADVIIAEPGAHVGFAGPRVIEQTTRQTLPPSFQTTEFLLAHGMIDMVTPRAVIRGTIGRLLRLHACRL